MYFPNGGVVSITTVLSDGTTVEAATVGDEGMLGVEAFLIDDAVAPGETLVPVAETNAERLNVDASDARSRCMAHCTTSWGDIRGSSSAR